MGSLQDYYINWTSYNQNAQSSLIFLTITSKKCVWSRIYEVKCSLSYYQMTWRGNICISKTRKFHLKCSHRIPSPYKNDSLLYYNETGVSLMTHYDCFKTYFNSLRTNYDASTTRYDSSQIVYYSLIIHCWALMTHYYYLRTQ